MISPHAHDGIRFQHTRDIKLRIVFDLQLIVVISDSQSTKHRVTLFHYVVSIHIALPISMGIIVTWLLTGANIQNCFQITHAFERFFQKKVVFTKQHYSDT